MTMAKFIALLSMIAAYAAVDFAVPVKATDFTQESNAGPTSALPGTEDSDDKVRPLPTNTTVEVAEERGSSLKVNSDTVIHWLRSLEELRNEPRIPPSGTAAFDSHTKVLTDVLERIAKGAKVNLSSEYIKVLAKFLVLKSYKNAVPHSSSKAELKPRAKDLQSAEFSLTKLSTKWKLSYNFLPPSELEKEMAFDIPFVPPSLTTMDGEEVLIYFYATEHQAWTTGLHLSEKELSKYAYVLTLNLRDAHIRQSFPRWYASVFRQAEAENALRSEFHLSEMAFEYYMTEYSIFRKFAEAFYKSRESAQTLPKLFQLSGVYRDVAIDRRAMRNILERTAEEAKVGLPDEVVMRLADHMMHFGMKPVHPVSAETSS